MKVIDLNLLLYSINKDSAHHAKSKKWLDQVLNEDEVIGLPWIVILGFLRISTNPRIFKKALSPEIAVQILDEWKACTSVRTLHPGSEHWNILKRLISESGTAGNLTTDAHLAALTIECGAVLNTTDTDFGRFKYLNWINPIA